MTPDEPTGSRWRRVVGLVGLAGRRVVTRTVRGFPNRTSMAIVIVAVAVALLVVITSVSLGLAAQTTVHGEEVDYWIVPERATTQTTVVSVEGPQLGDVHARTDRIRAIEGVREATPVLIELVQVRTRESNTSEYILGIGVIPSDETNSIAGVSTEGLSPGDPYYAGGSYDGEFTGEVVFSPAAATLLNATAGDALVVSSPASIRIAQSFAVTAVSETGLETVRGQVPVGVFHLSELQAYTGAQSGDQADQILVHTNAPAVKPTLEQIYPEATVVTRTGVATRQVIAAELPLAVSLVALVVGVGVSGLFVATTMGLTVDADRRDLAVLATIGFTARSRLALIAVTTFTITLIGGVLGIGLGSLGIVLTNALVTTQLGAGPVALFHPVLIPYGLGIAITMGLVAAPYPLVIARQTDILEELGR